MPFPPILCLIGFPFLPRERFQTISISLLGISFPFFFSNSKENVSSCVIINRQPRCITRIEKSNFQLNNIISRIVFFFFFFFYKTSSAIIDPPPTSTKSSAIDSYIPFHPKATKISSSIPFHSLSPPQTPPRNNLHLRRIWKPKTLPQKRKFQRSLVSKIRFDNRDRQTPDRRLFLLLLLPYPDSRTSCPLLQQPSSE